MPPLRKTAGLRGSGPGPGKLVFCLLLLLTTWPVTVAGMGDGDRTPPGHGPSPPPLTSRNGDVRIVADAAYFDTLVTLVRHARHRIDMAMFLFKTGTAKDNRPAHLVRELAQARQRGVFVRVILDLSGHDEKINAANRETARALEKAGIPVLFDSPGRTNHSKLVVIDGRHCLVGSHNLTQAALRHNHELSLLLDNPRLAGEILDYLDTLAN